MKRFHTALIVASAFLGLAYAPAGLARPTPDVEYKTITPPQPAAGKGVEVLEFFNYACSHCYDFEPLLKLWLKTKPVKTFRVTKSTQTQIREFQLISEEPTCI